MQFQFARIARRQWHRPQNISDTKTIVPARRQPSSGPSQIAGVRIRTELLGNPRPAQDGIDDAIVDTDEGPIAWARIAGICGLAPYPGGNIVIDDDLALLRCPLDCKRIGQLVM